MDNEIKEKVKMYKAINELAVKGEIVVFGSTFAANFPFYELMQGKVTDYAIYNRSIENLRVHDAADIVDDCVKSLSPKKLFIIFEDTDEINETFFQNFERLVFKVKRSLKNTEIYLIPACNTDTETALYEEKLKKLATKTRCTFISFNKSILLIPYKTAFNRMNVFFRNGGIDFTEAFGI